MVLCCSGVHLLKNKTRRHALQQAKYQPTAHQGKRYIDGAIDQPHHRKYRHQPVQKAEFEAPAQVRSLEKTFTALPEPGQRQTHHKRMNKIKNRPFRLAVERRSEILDRQPREQPDSPIQTDHAQQQKCQTGHQSRENNFF